jgi:NTE family protein
VTAAVPAPSVALVMGSGGVLGGSFHAGVVKALLDARGIDARSVEMIVATSCGAITAALLGAGLHPNDVYRRETGQPLSPSGQRIFGRARKGLGARGEQRSSLGAPVAPQLALKALWSAGQVSMGSVAAGLMPRGSASTDRIRRLVDGMADHREGVWAWPGDPYLQVCAVDLSTGRRKVFDGVDGESLGEAVAASCAVPGVYEPVRIGDREYLDGGAHSSDNVDVLAGRGNDYDLVVVSSPMSTEHLYDVASPWHALRVATRLQTDREIRTLVGASRVEVIRPGHDDLDAMGQNMLDGRRRAAVALQAYTTAVERLSA